tara:strand:+ start:1560 stop:4004 length:2445 start_codon:yes stop_codon:yes gene_type:complete
LYNKSQESIDNLNPQQSSEVLKDSNLNSQVKKSENLQKNDDIDLSDISKSILRRKRIVFGVTATIFLVFGINTIHKRIYHPIYQGSFTLLITDPIKTDSDISQKSVFTNTALNSAENKIDILIPFLKSPLVLNSLANEMNTAASQLSSRITITATGQNKNIGGIIKVSVKGPKKAENLKLLNSLEDLYLKISLDERRKKLNEGLKFLNKQAPFLAAKTKELQNKLADLRTKYNILDPTEEGVVLKQLMVEVDMKILELEQSNKRLKQIKSELKNGSLSIQGFAENYSNSQDGLSVTGSSQAVLQEVITLNNKLSKAKTIYRPESLIIKGLESRIESLQPLVEKNQMELVDLAINSNISKSQVLYDSKELINKTFLQQPLLIQRFDALTQELFLARENFAALSATRENFKLELGQETIPWKILSPSQVSSSPLSPLVFNDLLKGLGAGLLIGLFSALLRDRLDYVYFSPSDVSNELGTPLLSHIPYVELFEGVRENKKYILDAINQLNSGSKKGESSEKSKKKYQRFFYQEAFRNLFTSIRFLNAENKLKAIVLTSSIPSEGKTLVSILLAKTLSDLGERVLLVDCDLRRPQVHARLGLNNIKGMTNILIDPDSSWEDSVQKVEGYKNWSVITAGRKAPDPTRLLSSSRMKSISKAIKDSEDFDLILYDSPPILGMSDSSLISENTDGLILLTTVGFVDRQLPKEAIKRVENSKTNLLGIVTNSKRNDHIVSESYEYGYGGYGYGYGGYGGYGYVYDAYKSYVEEEEEEKDNPKTNQNLQQNKLTNKLKSIPYFYDFISKTKTLLIKTIKWIDKT